MSVCRVSFVALVVLMAGCGQIVTSTPRPTHAPVAPELAVQFALDALHADGPTGYLIGMPLVLRGQVMPLAEAYRRVNGQPLADSSPLARYRERAVWLVITRGKWVLHIPGGHGDPLSRTPSIGPKDITVPGLWNAILFDAVSGQVYDSGGIVQSEIPELERLPKLP